MNLNLSDTQKQLLIGVIVALLALAGSFFGVQQVANQQAAAQAAQNAAQLAAITQAVKAQQSAGASAGTLGIGQSRFAGAILDGDLEIRSDGVNDTGKIDTSGNVTVSGNIVATGSVSAAGITNTGGSSNTAYGSISAPTAVASATPVLRLNSLGAGNDLLSVEKASTPVFKIGNGGNVTLTGNLSVSGSLSQGASLQKCVAMQQSYIGSATVIPATLTAAGITTPFPAIPSIGQGPNNNVNLMSSTSSSGVVTINSWQAILGATLTPVASTTTVAETFLVCGQ